MHIFGQNETYIEFSLVFGGQFWFARRAEIYTQKGH